MLKFVRCAGRRLALLCHRSIRLGAKHLSRQADPFHRRLRARRRDRHLRAADFQRSAGGARPAGRDREPPRRRRLYRLEPRRLLRSGRLHAAACGERGRHQPGALQEIEVQLRSDHAIRRGGRACGVAVGAGRRQQRAGQDRGGAARLFEDRAAEDELRLRRRRLASRTSTSRCSWTRPACRPCTCPTRAAARRSATSSPATCR